MRYKDAGLWESLHGLNSGFGCILNRVTEAEKKKFLRKGLMWSDYILAGLFQLAILKMLQEQEYKWSFLKRSEDNTVAAAQVMKGYSVLNII